MSDNTLRVEMTRIKEVTPMEGCDNIELVWLFRAAPNGEPCIVAKAKGFEKGALVAYIPPDHMVPDVENFAFLDRHPEKALAEGASFIREKYRRVKAMKMRGYISHGLVISQEEVKSLADALGIQAIRTKDTQVGCMVGELLGITRYEPKKQRGQSMSGSNAIPQESPAGVDVPRYDLTGVRKLGDIFGWEGKVSDHELVATEKLHGTNARFMVQKKTGMFRRLRWVIRRLKGAKPAFEDKDYRLFVSSRGVWRDPAGNSLWARVAREQRLFDRLKKVPGVAVYGEIIGQAAQGEAFKYGLDGDVIEFRMFDFYIPETRAWAGWEDVHAMAEKLCLKTPPVFMSGFFKREDIEGTEDGKSLLDDETMREGWVIRTMTSSYTARGGRAIMKWKSEKFLQKHG